MHTNQFKRINDLNVRPEAIKNSQKKTQVSFQLIKINGKKKKRKHREDHHDIGLDGSLDVMSKNTANNSKNRKGYYIELKSSLQQNKQQSETATYRMGENMCKLYITRGDSPKRTRNFYKPIAKIKQITQFKNGQMT